MINRFFAASVVFLFSACGVRATPTEFKADATVREGTLFVELKHKGTRSCGWNLGRTFEETLEIGDDAVATANGLPMKVVSTRCGESWFFPWFTIPMSELQGSIAATGQLVIAVTASGETATWRFEGLNAIGAFARSTTQEEWSRASQAVFRWDGPHEPNTAEVKPVEVPLTHAGDDVVWRAWGHLVGDALSVLPTLRKAGGKVYEPQPGELPAGTYEFIASYILHFRETSGESRLSLWVEQPLSVTTTQ